MTMGRGKNRVGGAPHKSIAEAKTRNALQSQERNKTPEKEDSSEKGHKLKRKSPRRRKIYVGYVVAILVPLAAIYWSQNWTESGKRVIENDLDLETKVPRSQAWSLFEPYTVNYDDLLEERKENMKKYDFDYNVNGVDKRSQLSLKEFYDVYDGKWPVVVTDVISRWVAYNWSRDFFFEKYGKERVTMKAVDLDVDLAFSKMFLDDLSSPPSPALSDLHELELSDLTLSDLELGDLSPSIQNSLEQAVSLALPLELFYRNTHKAFPDKWTYVEDELFIPMRPELHAQLGECEYLKEDFYQSFPHDIRPWNAMLLWGTEYSRSSLHMDPYNWTGTNAVIKGRKRWKLYPPGQDHLLYVKGEMKSGFPLNCYKYNSMVDSYDVDLKRFPHFSEAKYLEFDQLPGEILFIPTGWYHQAYNVEETIAVSSQMMNRNNYRIILEEIFKLESNIKRSKLPRNIDSKTPEEQVEIVMRLLPQGILDRGRMITQDVINQIKYGYEKAQTMLPEPLE